MKLDGKSGFAILLIGCGALILLNKIGFHMGGLMGYLIPIAMIALGYFGIQSGRKILGGIVLLLGILILIGKFSWLIGLIIAFAMIAYGASMLKGTGRSY
ncbi:Uncharacterised protein [Chlamydia abortus]|jgi:lia operon protein LiaI|uniref:LiaF transmembrane domain-containing protein n=1 Tax=Paenibacillus residui TaxID=629724 RepID=A0ABW3D6H4_9BACL|nr:hypothetical protein [Paenibacillus sp. 32O-W]SHE13573.1 Uncharacterised protein [Chlamydia abortus]